MTVLVAVSSNVGDSENDGVRKVAVASFEDDSVIVTSRLEVKALRD
jgi:hypothetical protein